MYKYKCQSSGALYVGQTRRHIHTRISEYMGVSSKTGNKLSVSRMSAVLTHHHLSKHTMSDSDFSILTSGNSKFDLEMRESPHFQIETFTIIVFPLCLCISFNHQSHSNLTWYADISVITNGFVLILTHCFCNSLTIRPFLFEFLL